jgi:hypothetical protein
MNHIHIGDHVQLIDYDPWLPPAGYPYCGITGVVVDIADDLVGVREDEADENGMRKIWAFHPHELATLP